MGKYIVINTITKQPLEILIDGKAGPYLNVPENMANKVQDLFRIREFSFWTGAAKASTDGDRIVTIVFSRTTAPSRIQQLLDEVKE